MTISLCHIRDCVNSLIGWSPKNFKPSRNLPLPNPCWVGKEFLGSWNGSLILVHNFSYTWHILHLFNKVNVQLARKKYLLEKKGFNDEKKKACNSALTPKLQHLTSRNKNRIGFINYWIRPRPWRTEKKNTTKNKNKNTATNNQQKLS